MSLQVERRLAGQGSQPLSRVHLHNTYLPACACCCWVWGRGGLGLRGRRMRCHRRVSMVRCCALEVLWLRTLFTTACYCCRHMLLLRESLRRAENTLVLPCKRAHCECEPVLPRMRRSMSQMLGVTADGVVSRAHCTRLEHFTKVEVADGLPMVACGAADGRPAATGQKLGCRTLQRSRDPAEAGAVGNRVLRQQLAPQFLLRGLRLPSLPPCIAWSDAATAERPAPAAAHGGVT